MAETSSETVNSPFNFKAISCGEFRHQARLFNKAFQYLIKPSWQLALSEVFLAAIPLITFCFVANVGYDQLIGIGYGISLCNIFGLGFCFAAASACHEIALKKEDSREAAITIQRGLFITLTVMCFPIWAVWLNAGPLFRAFKQEQVPSSLGDEYCFMFLPGLPVFIIVLFLQKYMNLVRGNAALPIVVCNIFGALLNVGLNAAFVNGLNMGVRGGALASVVTYLCMALYLVFCIIWNPKYRNAWPGFTWSLLYEWEPLAVRILPYIAWVIVEWWTLDIGIYVVGTLDAYNRRLGTQIVLCLVIRLLAMIADRFAAEASDQVEEAVNARYNQRAVFIVKCSVLITWIGSFLCGFLLFALPKYIPSSFTNNRPFGLSVTETIILISPIPFLKGTQALGFKVMGKVKSKVLNLVFVVIGFWVGALPIGLALVYLRNWVIIGFWTGYISGLLFQALMFLISLKDCMQEWKRNEKRKNDAPPTPSGVFPSDYDDIDGYYSGKSLLLGEPRIRARFTHVESGGDEEDGLSRPTTPLLIYRGFVVLFSCGTLIAGLVIRATISGFERHVQNAS